MNSFQSVLDISIPAITFFLMTVVGMDLTMEDFRRIRSFPRSFIVGALCQYLLPLVALVTLRILRPQPEILGGILLLAAAPGGGISNYYSYVARVNVALSVVLTAASTLTAAATMPLLIRFLEFSLASRIDFHVPLKTLFAQLCLLLLLPVLIGAAIRRNKPAFVQRYDKLLRRIGFLALGVLIAFILIQTRVLFLSQWRDIILAASLFILLSMALGYLSGVVFRLNRKESFTILIECGTRNLGITTTAAVVLLKRTEFATLAATYFLVEAVLILSLTLVSRNFLARDSRSQDRPAISFDATQ